MKTVTYSKLLEHVVRDSVTLTATDYAKALRFKKKTLQWEEKGAVGKPPKITVRNIEKWALAAQGLNTKIVAAGIVHYPNAQVSAKEIIEEYNRIK